MTWLSWTSAVGGWGPKRGMLADADGALDRLDGMGQELVSWKCWNPCQEPLPCWREFNQPLELANEWQMCQICPMELDAHRLCVRLAHPQSLNTTLEYSWRAAFHPGSLKTIGGVEREAGKKANANRQL